VDQTPLRALSERLLASGTAERSIRAGSYAPDFRLPGLDGREVTLRALIERGCAILTFFSGGWCEGCIDELQALEGARASIERRSGSLAAISQQSPADNARMSASLGIGFPILADRGGRVSAQFGVRWRVPERLRALCATHGIDLPSLNGEGSWTFPIPALFVVDRSGLIVYSEVNPGQGRRSTPAEFLPVLDAARDIGAA
jgi:peroxiredoxin